MTAIQASEREDRPRRRRGAVLEASLLEAAWDELMAVGYMALTMEGVAARAHTGKMVLYRRWPTRPELVLAALRHHKTVAALPDTGSLRGDVLVLLRDVARRWGEFAGVITFLLADYYRETGLALSAVREQVSGGSAEMMQALLWRAAGRGEIDAARVNARVVRLPIDLVRFDAIMGQAPPPEADLEEIVDTVFLPLLAAPR